MTITVTIDKRFTCISDLYLKHQHHQRLINRLLLCTQTSDGKPEALGEQTVCHCSLPFAWGQKFVFSFLMNESFFEEFSVAVEQERQFNGNLWKEHSIDSSRRHLSFSWKERKNKKIDGKNCYLIRSDCRRHRISEYLINL